MKLRLPVAVFLFVPGGAAALAGLARSALYFAFGVVVSLLVEIATSSVDSAPKAALCE